MLGSAVVVRGTPTGPAGDDLRFGFDGDIDDLHLRLSVAGPFERIRDECGRGGLLARLRLLLFHLTVGGELRMLLPPAGGGFDEARDRLLSFVAEVNALRGSAELSPPVIERTDVRPNPERDLHAFAASLGDLRVDDDLVVATSRVDTCAKIPEDRMNDLLRARPDIGHVIDTVPGTTRTARGRFRSSSPEETRPDEYAAPELSLREYHGPVVAPRQVAIHDNVVLPESFRNPVRARLRSRTLVDWSKQFVRRPDLPPLPMLPGRWFYLDNIMRGHFGHALTEQLSHVWAWPRAKRDHPDLRALVFRWEDHEMADWELRLFEAAGIDRADVTVLDNPRASKRSSPPPRRTRSAPTSTRPSSRPIARSAGHSAPRRVRSPTRSVSSSPGARRSVPAGTAATWRRTSRKRASGSCTRRSTTWRSRSR